MTTLRTSSLSKPETDDKISAGTLRYMAVRNRQKAFDLVIKEFKKSGISQATLGRRLGKAPEVISRLLARPRNWELDTFSELMFGISGVQPHYSVSLPHGRGEARLPASPLAPHPPSQPLKLQYPPQHANSASKHGNFVLQSEMPAAA